MLLGTIRGGGRGRRIVQFGGKVYKKGIARRRQRVAAGQPVMFGKIRARRQRRGKPLPIGNDLTVHKKVQKLASEITLAPVGVNKTQTTRNPAGASVCRTEQSFEVQATDGAGATSIPITAMNTVLFAALPEEAAQYQYYKFVGLSFDYTPALWL